MVRLRRFSYLVATGDSTIIPYSLFLIHSSVRHSVSDIEPFDLHVLGTPPAFVLSQDQTLNIWYLDQLTIDN